MCVDNTAIFRLPKPTKDTEELWTSSLRWFTSVMRVNEIQCSRGKVMHSGNNTLELVMLVSGF